MIELRSDTFTLPTEEMFAAAVSVPLGDDVWREDSTVNSLEAQSAQMLGKEAALFVSSGTQGNLIAMLSQTCRGDEVIVGELSHIFNNEVAGAAVVGGLQLHAVPNNERGMLEMSALHAAVRSVDVHHAPTTLLCVENSHNQCGGTVLDQEDMGLIRAVADGAGARVHVDGARIFNAATALGITAADLALDADSITFCLSKGLSAPVGSVLCGSSEFIERARRYRKMLGGGMRQAGVIAGPGLVALQTMTGRLGEDHRHARRIACALAGFPGVWLDLDSVQTNIVIFNIEASGRLASDLVQSLASRGVLVAPVGRHTVRLVTHRGVTSAEVDKAIEVLMMELSGAEVAVGS